MKIRLSKGLLIAGSLSVFAFVAASALAAVVSGANSSKMETPLGDLVADALKLSAHADAALCPADLLEEADLPTTAATADVARAALTAPNESLMTIKVSGKQLMGALERSVALAPRKNQGFLQVAGLLMTFDPAHSEGNRVNGVVVNGLPLKPDKIYSIAMPDSLAHGALGYFKFWDSKDAKPVTDAKGAKLTVLDSLVARLKTGKLPTTTDNRIKSH